MKAKDSVRIWFETLSSEGEDMDILLQCDVGEGMQDYRFHHGRFDAIGGFLSNVKNVDNPQTTLTLRGKQVPLYKFILGFIRYSLRLPFFASPFIKFDKDWRKGEKFYPRCAEFLELSFTESLMQKAKNNCVSVNTYLLESLNHTVKDYVMKNGKEVWLIPVNLRTNTKDNLSQNEVGFVDAVINKEDGLFEIQNQLQKRIKKNEHLGGLFGVGIGVITGEFLLKLLVKTNKYLQMRTGVFTNLGEWKVAGCDHFKLSGFPPVLETQPIGASAITWNGKMTLSLHSHPCLGLNQDDIETMMSKWINKLKE